MRNKLEEIRKSNVTKEKTVVDPLSSSIFLEKCLKKTLEEFALVNEVIDPIRFDFGQSLSICKSVNTITNKVTQSIMISIEAEVLQESILALLLFHLYVSNIPALPTAIEIQ